MSKILGRGPPMVPYAHKTNAHKTNAHNINGKRDICSQLFL